MQAAWRGHLVFEICGRVRTTRTGCWSRALAGVLLVLTLGVDLPAQEASRSDGNRRGGPATPSEIDWQKPQPASSPRNLSRPTRLWTSPALSVARQEAAGEGASDPVETVPLPPPAVIPARTPDAGGARSAPSSGVRLPLLPDLPPGLAVPSPTPEIARKFNRFIEQEISPETTMTLVVNRPRILKFRAAPLRLYIPHEDIAQFEVISDTEVAIVGRTTGTTALNIWVRDPEQPEGQQVLSYLIQVIDDPSRRQRLDLIYAALETEINQNFPDSVVRLSLVGDKLLIRGEAKDVEDATQILRIVGANAPGGPQRLSLQNINVNVLATQDADGQYPEGGLQDLVTSGTGQDAEQANSTVINMLRIPGVQQVMLKVTVAEVNRNALRSLGANLSVGQPDTASFLSFLGPESFAGPAGMTTAAINGGRLLIDRGDFRLALTALRTLNLARSLAEPNLVTLNGQPARFQAGGEFPVPQITGFTAAGLQGVQFVPFGVQLRFIPVVTDKDRVRLAVAANVSTRNPGIGTNIGSGGAGGGTSVPGLNTRNFQTTVELRSGETLAVGGLIQNNFGYDSNRVPFLGDIPLVSRLFANDNTTFGEQELVILVTPYLVQPLAGEGELPLPGSDVFEPDDIEFFLRGRLEGCRAEDFRSTVRTDIHRQKAFRTQPQQYIIGPSGYSDGRR